MTFSSVTIGRRQFLTLGAGAFALPAMSLAASADTYPTRPVRLIVGFTAGAASDVVARIFAESDRLSDFPQLGRVGIVPGTYECTVPGLPYVIVHELNDDTDEIVVLGIFHGAHIR